jgi:hypothetical protein
LNVSLSFFVLDFVISPSKTSKRSFSVVWIASSPLFSKELDLESSPTSKKKKKRSKTLK